jgi:hypothetical protein
MTFGALRLAPKVGGCCLQRSESRLASLEFEAEAIASLAAT